MRTQEDYFKTVGVLNQLLDAGAADELSSLAELANALAEGVEHYENVNNPPVDVAPGATFRFLMEQHKLSESELPEIGVKTWCQRFCVTNASVTFARFKAR